MRLSDKTTKHKDFIRLYSDKMGCSEKNAEKYLEGFIDTLYDCMKAKSSITIQHLGKFYVSERKESTAFKFNPSQKMKAILGWSSNYKGNI
ncbi:HU family DNA-binding protein [uncultured Microscilla sp.]|uniref:HU family DNA-binding protein n=1 Tax=uncultured Microscilla sp. TaxID=432653 RepID=UPI00262096A8|nr:HU family DNA-binding protein [uncultured Microscilla sp.]